MLLSYSHQFIFVHVPKTGGQSIRRTLAPYAHQPKAIRFNRLLGRVGIRTNLLIGPPSWRWFRVHHSASIVRRHLPAATFNQFFKFAFVRNPWDRAVSLYHFCLKQPKHHWHKRVNALGSFASFIDWRVGRRSLLQADLIADRQGRLLVDFVGRFESLPDDFERVCRRIGVEAALPKVNASNHADYRTYYDDATAERVANFWRRDIELFGYTFDGIGSSAMRPTTMSPAA